MAGDDRYGRVDEMEQEVQCRGEMTGAQEQNNRRGGDRENQDYQDSGSCQLQAKAPVERYRCIHVILASTMTHQDAERRGREKNILVQ